MSRRLGKTALPAINNHLQTRSIPRLLGSLDTVARRYKASLADVELDQRGYAQGYHSSSPSSSSPSTSASSSTSQTMSTDRNPLKMMKVDYNNAGMPTPPLSPKLGAQVSCYPPITPQQDLLRLKHHLAQLPSNLLKHVHLQRVRKSNPDLFFRALADDINTLAPLVYTPTVGEACQKYSEIYNGPEGLQLSIEHQDDLHSILSTYASQTHSKPQVIVVTDGSRILGLGDLGVGGMGISVGKLNLYTAGGGVNPEGHLPVVLDMGTNNSQLLQDPLYIGLRRPRATLAEATQFMDRFMAAASSVFPDAIIQHEDFYSEAAFDFLERYQDKYRMFNDDIQGTGSVILGGFINAAERACAASGKDPRDHRVVFLGGGSAAVGVAKEMMNYFTMKGLTEQEAKERFWLIDTKGLITHSRPDVVNGKLASHKKYFIRNDTTQEFASLAEVVEHVKPTALVGLSTTFGAFAEPVVRRMSGLNPAPIIFPLSNPTSKCELSFSDALEWTDGSVLFASGSPYPAQTYKGVFKEPGQGNNFLVFPGIGFGALACGATRVTDDMITASALGLSLSLTREEREAGLLYPRLDRIREVSASVAARVVRAAQKAKVDTVEHLRSISDDELVVEMSKVQWQHK